MEKLFLATKNQHKAEEFTRILEPFGFAAVPLPPEVPESPENGGSFEANVMEKAAFYCRYCDGLILADDSGICVDALGGAPGVYSARYAGENATDEENRHKLLRDLADTPDHQRGASMVSVVALWRQDGPVGLIGKGMVRGEILRAPRGDFGFGYDPLFYIPDLGKSMAELTPSEKNSLSHRARAVHIVMDAWKRL